MHKDRRGFLGLLSVGALAPVAARASDNTMSPDFERQAVRIRAVLDSHVEEEIKTLIARWYEETRKHEDGRRYLLVGNRAIVDRCPPVRQCGVEQPAVLTDLFQNQRRELAWSALQFSYEISGLRFDRYFARVDVRERGWYYASTAETTYENAAVTLFLLERDDAGAWNVMAHQTDRTAVRPDHRDEPMPDLREMYYDLLGQEPAKQP